MQHSHSLPLPSRIYPPFLQLYAALPEYNPALQESTLPSQNIALPPPLR